MKVKGAKDKREKKNKTISDKKSASLFKTTSAPSTSEQSLTNAGTNPNTLLPPSSSSETVDVGTRVDVLFNGDEWFGAIVTFAKKDEYGKVNMVGIIYDNGDLEEFSWPDEDVVLAKQEKPEMLKKESNDSGYKNTSQEYPLWPAENGYFFVDKMNSPYFPNSTAVIRFVNPDKQGVMEHIIFYTRMYKRTKDMSVPHE